MKKIFICSLILALGAPSFAAKPEDLVLIYKASKQDQIKIYNNFVDKTLVAEKTNYKVRGYHVTVGWIRNVGSAEELRKFMKKEAKSKGRFNFNFSKSGIMNVSPKCPDPKNLQNPLNKKCKRKTVTLLPADETLINLRRINKELNEALDRYNKLNDTRYKMDKDLLPQYFEPHITLANTNQFKNQASRLKAINQVNEKMHDHSSFYFIKLN